VDHLCPLPEPSAGPLDCICVAIQANQPYLREALCYRRRVAARPDSRIDINRARARQSWGNQFQEPIGGYGHVPT
jgi:hypothetical protein